MKSFKQKLEEKKALAAEHQRIQEEQNKIRWEQEESDRLEKKRLAEIERQKQYEIEQRLYEERLWQKEQAQKQYEAEQKQLQEEKRWKQQIESHELNRQQYNKSKQDQKSIIKNILNEEYIARHEASEELYEINNQEAHKKWLSEQEQKRLQLEEKERKQLEEIERLEAEQLAEQAKYDKWNKISEEIKQEEEQEKLEEERLLQQDKKLRETAERLQQIEEERLEYETRQKYIAEREAEQRTAINKVLSEAEQILSSHKQSSFKNTLSGLHDYIYRLKTNVESDPWTNRKQPMSVLTWEQWKSDPTNKLLIEEDFRRARLLFEQDNQRAQRYYDQIYMQMPARNLTLQRLESIALENKLSGLSRGDLISARKQLVEDIDGLYVWLDAGNPDAVEKIATSSLATASISVFWKPDSMLNQNKSTMNLGNIESAVTANLEIISSSALFDNDPNTFCTIRHTSGSSEGVVDYDWNDRWLTGPNQGSSYSGTIMMRVSMSSAVGKNIERLELQSTDRKFIPTIVTSFIRRNGSETYDRRKYYNITASFNGTGNAQLSTGGEHLSSKNGGAFGITPEGSASLDPLRINGLYPFRKYDNEQTAPMNYDEEYYVKDIVLDLSRMATGSEVRINSLNILYFNETSGSVEHGDGVHCWRSHGGHISASYWKRGYHPKNAPESRRSPIGYPIWYSGSKGEPEGISMPYIAFSSQSYTQMIPGGDFNDISNGTTLFSVFSSEMGVSNYEGMYYGDKGDNFRTAMQYGISNFNKDLSFLITDWKDQGELTSANQRHKIFVGTEQADGELDEYGVGLTEAATTPWPYRNEDVLSDKYPGLSGYRGHSQRQTLLVTYQVENPMTEPSSSIGRLWKSGGTPFVDLDAFPITDYILTGSSYGQPQLGADGRSDLWFSGRIHEMIQFDRDLSLTEIETVHNYLRDKWQVRANTVHSDKRGDFIYGLSSSISGQDQWMFDPTNTKSATDNIYSSSQWELK